jgi:sorbitol-specific phosphotransferase system component IIA
VRRWEGSAWSELGQIGLQLDLAGPHRKSARTGMVVLENLHLAMNNLGHLYLAFDQRFEHSFEGKKLILMRQPVVMRMRP